MENDQQSGLPPLLNGQLHMQQFQDYYNQLVAIASGPKDRSSTLGPLGINYSFTPQQLMTIANGSVQNGGPPGPPLGPKLDTISHLQTAQQHLVREADNITPPYGSPLSNVVSTTHSLLPGGGQGPAQGSGIFPTLASHANSNNVPNLPLPNHGPTNGFPAHVSHAQSLVHNSAAGGVAKQETPGVANGQHYSNTSSTLVILSQSQDTALHQVFICSLPATLCNGQKIQIITETGASVTTVISRLTLDLNRNATRPPEPERQEAPPPPRPPIPAPLPIPPTPSSSVPAPVPPDTRGGGLPPQTNVPLSPGSPSELSSPAGSTASSFKQELSISAYLNSAEHRSEEERQDEITRTVQSVAQEVLSDHFSEPSSRNSKKSRPRSSVDPKLNSTELSDGSNTVDGINLEEIKEFAKAFKMKRLSLGLTQTQVGQALSIREGPAYSQSAICRFEKLDITPKSAQKIKPVLDRWMREVDEQLQAGQLHPSLIGGKALNPPSRAQQILDSVCQQASALGGAAPNPTGGGSSSSGGHTPETELLPAPTIPTSLLFPTATVTSSAAGPAPLGGMPGTGCLGGMNPLGGVNPGIPGPPGALGGIPPQLRPVSSNAAEGNTKKRKRRTSFTPQALDALNEYFEKNTHPTGTEMTMVAEHLNYDREVVRVWFCNKRQALKNTIKKLKQQTGLDDKPLSDSLPPHTSGSF